MTKYTVYPILDDLKYDLPRLEIPKGLEKIGQKNLVFLLFLCHFLTIWGSETLYMWILAGNVSDSQSKPEGLDRKCQKITVSDFLSMVVYWHGGVRLF